MRKKFFSVLVTLILVVSFLMAGCAAPKEEVRRYSWGSFHTGTMQYMYGGMFAGLALTELPDIVITNEATSGTTEGLDLLRRGEIALTGPSPAKLYEAYNAVGRYEGEEKLRVGIMWGYVQQANLLFTLDPDIKSFRDLEGKKVCIGPAGSSNEAKNSIVLEASGYTRTAPGEFDFAEIEISKMSYPEAAAALAEGVTDAVIATQPFPEPSHYELSLRLPLKVIPLDKDIFDEVLKVYSWFGPVKVPAGTYQGQDEELETLGDPNYIVGHLDLLPEEDAYRLTKVYVEKILPLMAEQFDSLKGYVANPQALVSGWSIPGHPGAMRYYDEIGLKPTFLKVD